jgi:hypothetical protein
MTVDLWYYLGAIMAQAGTALLAIGLVIVRTSDMDATKQLKMERKFALASLTLLIVGILIQLDRLFFA